MKTKFFAIIAVLFTTTAFANVESGPRSEAAHNRCIQQNCQSLTGVQLDECTAHCASQHAAENNAKYLPSRKNHGVN